MSFESWESDLAVTSSSWYKKSWVVVADTLWRTTSGTEFCTDTKISHLNDLENASSIILLEYRPSANRWK